MQNISRSFIFSLIFIFGLLGFVASQVEAAFFHEVVSLGNRVTAGVWEVIEEPDWDEIVMSLDVFEGGVDYEIGNTLQNSSFENDFDNWNTKGEVGVVLSDQNHNIFPKNGSKMAKIGHQDNSPSLLSNSLSQQLVFPQSSPQALSFWYNLVSYEDLRGFDEPAFAVYLDDKMIYQVWAEDFRNEASEAPHISETPHISGWKQAILRLPPDLSPPTSLTFYAGNTGDDLASSFVYLDNISTEILSTNSSSQISLKVSSPQDLPDNLKINYQYYLDDVAVSGSTIPGETKAIFSFFAQPDDYLFTYWLSDDHGHTSSSTILSTYVNDTAPQQITDLEVHLETENELSVVFTSPVDSLFDRVSFYEARYSDQPITNSSDWFSLPLLQAKNFFQPPDEVIASRFSGQREKLLFNFPGEVGTYYLAVKSIDNSGNYSNLSNIISFTKE